VRRKISAGHLRPGDRLPTRAVLAQQHDASGSTVQEALLLAALREARARACPSNPAGQNRVGPSFGETNIHTPARFSQRKALWPSTFY
jgi:DNA-binding transcriptional MocR family regulator